MQSRRRTVAADVDGNTVQLTHQTILDTLTRNEVRRHISINTHDGILQAWWNDESSLVERNVSIVHLLDDVAEASVCEYVCSTLQCLSHRQSGQLKHRSTRKHCESSLNHHHHRQTCPGCEDQCRSAWLTDNQRLQHRTDVGFETGCQHDLPSDGCIRNAGQQQPGFHLRCCFG